MLSPGPCQLTAAQCICILSPALLLCDRCFGFREKVDRPRSLPAEFTGVFQTLLLSRRTAVGYQGVVPQSKLLLLSFYNAFSQNTIQRPSKCFIFPYTCQSYRGT